MKLLHEDTKVFNGRFPVVRWRMWRWEDVEVGGCGGGRMWRWEDVEVGGCEGGRSGGGRSGGGRM